jgi:hypothetical protein
MISLGLDSFKPIEHEDSVNLYVYAVYIKATGWPIYCCASEKEANSKKPQEVALKSPNLTSISGQE